MRIVAWILATVAVAGLTVGQPLCCVARDCCGTVNVEARSPRGVDAPCCKNCVAADDTREDESPAPRRKCECAKKQAHLTPAGEEVVSLDVDLFALPVIHEAAAPAPAGAFAVAIASLSPPRVGFAQSLPLLL